MENMEEILTVDDVLRRIKPMGRYQAFVIALYAYHTCIIMVNNGFMAYGGLYPTWTCSLSDGSITAPSKNCTVFDSCPRANLSYQAEFYSIRPEWDLVCDRKYYARLISSIQMFGVLAGAFLYGHAADHWGRKWTYLAVKVVHIVVGCLSALSPTWQVFAGFRFVLGFLLGAEMVVCWVFTSEVTTNRERFLMRIIGGCPFFYMTDQTLVAWLTKEWKGYTWLGNLHQIPCFFLVLLFTFESPRWLLQKRRSKDAAAVLRGIARFNGTTDQLPASLVLQEPVNARQKFFVYDLFTHGKQLASYTAATVCLWFVVGMIYYGMYFNLGALGGSSVYLGIFFFGLCSLVGIPLGIVDYKLPHLFNRHRLVVGVMTVATLANALVVVLQASGLASAAPALLTVVSIVGQVANSLGFDMAYIYAVELFPTLLRSIANSLNSASARAGSMLAPQVLYLQNFWTPLPYIVFCGMAFAAAVVVYFVLPDTKNEDLPEEVQRRAKSMLQAEQEDDVVDLKPELSQVPLVNQLT